MIYKLWLDGRAPGYKPTVGEVIMAANGIGLE